MHEHFSISGYTDNHKGRTVHTMDVFTPVVEHWLEREMNPPRKIDPTTQCTMSYDCFRDLVCIVRKERNVLFNDALNTFYLWLYGIGYMTMDHLDSERFRLFIGFTFRLAARDLLYGQSHRQNRTYHGF